MPKVKIMRARFWFFTWNTEAAKIADQLDTMKGIAERETTTYLVTQLEKAPTTGRLHWQGAVYFMNPRVMAGVKRLFGDPSVHLEKVRGTPRQTREYCTKEETRAPPEVFKSLEVGSLPSQGSRSDLMEVITYIQEHPLVTELELWQMAPLLMIQYGKRLLHLARISRPQRRFQTAIICLWGPSGTGKSYRVDRWAMEAGVELYVMPTRPSATSEPWADGYDSQPIVLLEDFEATVPFRILLQMMDPYRLQMPIKGGFVNFAPRYLVMTSNINPNDWYKRSDSNGDDSEWRRPLLRRLQEDYCTIYHVTSRQQEFNNPFVAVPDPNGAE